MKVIWSGSAIRDLAHLREFIEKDSGQNAALVARRIRKAVDLLQSHPEIGRPGRVIGTRELVFPIPLSSLPTAYGTIGLS